MWSRASSLRQGEERHRHSGVFQGVSIQASLLCLTISAAISRVLTNLTTEIRRRPAECSIRRCRFVLSISVEDFERCSLLRASSRAFSASSFFCLNWVQRACNCCAACLLKALIFWSGRMLTVRQSQSASSDASGLVVTANYGQQCRIFSPVSTRKRSIVGLTLACPRWRSFVSRAGPSQTCVSAAHLGCGLQVAICVRPSDQVFSPYMALPSSPAIAGQCERVERVGLRNCLPASAWLRGWLCKSRRPSQTWAGNRQQCALVHWHVPFLNHVAVTVSVHRLTAGRFRPSAGAGPKPCRLNCFPPCPFRPSRHWPVTGARPGTMRPASRVMVFHGGGVLGA